MIAVDTSAWIDYLGGSAGAKSALVDTALANKQVVLPPVVLSELLSNPKAAPTLIALFLAVPLLAIEDGFWERATSLGGVESLIEHRASYEGAQSPCPPDLLRLSAGIEDVEDLWRDLDQTLSG